ncbi:MAG: hypothetical protein L3K52_16015 [Candidatus Thiothrix sulfatifontis]|nr:MAG: hypothetical protein L3K52_16015 [Candidatus Thiothrix sulfatifontis]
MPTDLTHYAPPGFWRHYNALPEAIQQLAKKQYQLLKANPHHHSLRFQPKHGTPYWAARVSQDYRALARYQGNGNYLWLWIGTHSDYQRLLSGK